MRKLFIVFTIIISILIIPNKVQASKSTDIYDKTNTEITTREANVVWVHKRTNGVLYKRKFNKVTGKWIGGWIRV